MSKKNQLEYIIDTENPKIIAICESKLDDSIADSSIFPMNKFNIFRKDRNIFGGGVLFAIAKDIKALIVQESLNFSSELVSIDIFINNYKIRLILIYNRPNNDANLHILLNDILSIINNVDFVFCVGDFNLSYINFETLITPTRLQSNFIFSLYERGLMQIIDEPTRFFPPHILDLIFINDIELLNFVKICAPIGSSDHCSIRGFINCKYNSDKILFWNFKKANIDLIKYYLISINWHNVLFEKGIVNGVIDIDQMYSAFCDIIIYIMFTFIPYEYIPVCDKYWPSYIRQLIKKRDDLFKTYTRDVDLYAKFEYDNLNISINKLQFEFLKKKELNLLNNASNKKFFNYVNSKIKNRSTLPPFKDTSGNLIYNDSDKCEFLNKHFSSVFKDEILPVPQNFSHDINEFFDSFNFDYNLLEKALKKLPLSPISGPDMIPAFFIRLFYRELFMPLFIIYDFCINFNCLPKILKSSNITVIYKNKGNRDNPDNYRDISILCNFVKPLEFLINENIIEFCFRNNIFSAYQHGFLKNRSTSSNLLECVFKWHTSIDRGM